MTMCEVEDALMSFVDQHPDPPADAWDVKPWIPSATAYLAFVWCSYRVNRVHPEVMALLPIDIRLAACWAARKKP